MSFQGYKDRIFPFCQNVNVRGARFRYSSPLPKISGNMRFSCREAETYCQRYADLTCHEVCRKDRSYCMRTVEVQVYVDVFPSI